MNEIIDNFADASNIDMAFLGHAMGGLIVGGLMIWFFVNIYAVYKECHERGVYTDVFGWGMAHVAVVIYVTWWISQ